MNISSLIITFIGLIYYFLTGNFYFLGYYSFLAFLSYKISKQNDSIYFVLLLANIIFFITSSSNAMRAFHEPQYLILMMCLVYLVFNYRKFNQEQTIISSKSIIIFLIFISISYIYGLFNSFSNQGFIFQKTGIANYLDLLSSCLLGLVVIKSNFNKKDLWIIIKYFLSISVSIIFGSYLIQYLQINPFEQIFLSYSDESRFGGINGANPNNFGRFMIMPLLMSFIFIINNLKIREWSKKWSYFLFFFIFISILFTFSRTTYMSTSIGLIAIFLFNKKNTIFKKFIFLGMISFFIIQVVSFFGIMDIFSTSARLSSEDSGMARILRYESGLKIITSNPIFGVHPGNYKEALYDNITIARSSPYFNNYTAGSAHNMFLHTAVPYGIPAGILLLFFPLAIFKKSYSIIKNKKNLINNIDYSILLLGLSLMLAILVHGLTEVYPYSYLFLYYSIFLTYICNCNRGTDLEKK